MFFKGSRYDKARAFGPRADETEPFAGVRAREIGTATGVVEHTLAAGDRLDLLARHYYNDDRLWWRIVDANPEFLNGADMLAPELEGTVIVIPRARE